MHTHFGSATNVIGTFLGVLLVGSFWKLGWLHSLSFAQSRNINWLQGLSRAALFQYN